MMKKITAALLGLMLIAQPLSSQETDWLEVAVQEMNETHQTRCCTEDPIFTKISSSMVAWGVGMFVGIALLAGFIHQSPEPTPTPASSTTGN